VLILDDDDAVRESFMDYFEDRGWLVVPAATAEEALNVLARELLDGALVDIRLPGMNGNEFIREVCRRNIGLVCILCTGSPEYRPPADITTLPQVSDHVFNGQRVLIDGNVFHPDITGRGHEITGEHSHGCCFSGAVGSQQPDNFSFFNIQVDLIHRTKIIIIFG
jgi:hypothetical protein